MYWGGSSIRQLIGYTKMSCVIDDIEYCTVKELMKGKNGNIKVTLETKRKAKKLSLGKEYYTIL
jgi:hypothetical protein